MVLTLLKLIGKEDNAVVKFKKSMLSILFYLAAIDNSLNFWNKSGLLSLLIIVFEGGSKYLNHSNPNSYNFFKFSKFNGNS